jgi:hypothetical protein
MSCHPTVPSPAAILHHQRPCQRARSDTEDLAGMPAGPHKILIELVNANHEVFPGQSKTVSFTWVRGRLALIEGRDALRQIHSRPRPRGRQCGFVGDALAAQFTAIKAAELRLGSL